MLPFETLGMDDPVPTVDFSPTGNTEAVYSFERSDVDGKYSTPLLYCPSLKNSYHYRPTSRVDGTGGLCTDAIK
jgi:hypothetical protein